MTAEPLLTLVARLLARHHLDVVLIGNAAAALQGSPVTTVDLDFMFRKTPGNLRKLRRLADDLEATVLRPYYPASELYRVTRDRDGLQLDFMARVDGIRRYESLRARAAEVSFGKASLRVAALEDIIKSRWRRTGRRIAPCSPSSGRPCVKRNRTKRTQRLSPLRRESDRALVEQIRRLLALPMNKRTNFLRKKVSLVGSVL